MINKIKILIGRIIFNDSKKNKYTIFPLSLKVYSHIFIIFLNNRKTQLILNKIAKIFFIFFLLLKPFIIYKKMANNMDIPNIIIHKSRNLSLNPILIHILLN